MRSSIAFDVASIEARLACPGCTYSLKGLEGDVVQCPECGLSVDRAILLTARWHGPWFSVPGFSTLLRPVAWLSVMALVALFAAGVSITRVSGASVLAGLALVTLVGWLALLVRLRDRLISGLAVPLTLFAHLLFVGYAATLGATIWIVVRVILIGLPAGLPFLVLLVPCLVGFWLCRRGERLIASHCLRDYLVRAVQRDE